MAALMLQRGVAVFSNLSSVAGGSFRARATNRRIHVPNQLAQASVGEVKQARRGSRLVCVFNSPGYGATSSEEPDSEDIQNSESVPDTPKKTGCDEIESKSGDDPLAAIDQFAEPLPRPKFFDESVDGNVVECNIRGCRPLHNNVLAEEYRQLTSNSCTTGACLTEVENNILKNAFRDALEKSPGDAQLVWLYAMVSWISLRDIDAAEELFDTAVQLAPHDTDIQASHARFLFSLGQ